MTTRIEISDEHIKEVIELVLDRWEHHLQPDQKGRGIFVSRHETLGVLEEEYHELIEAVHDNNEMHFREEMLDNMVVLLHGLASRLTEKYDW